MNLSTYPPSQTPTDHELLMKISVSVLYKFFQYIDHHSANNGITDWSNWLKHEYGATLLVDTDREGMFTITGLQFTNLDDMVKFKLEWW